jgi:amidohydrolase
MATIADEAQRIQDELRRHRRTLHQYPELDIALPRTTEYVRGELQVLGYSPKECGPSGLVALAGHPGEGPTILLRADMDGLPVTEATDLEFRSTNGNAHACGHDMHTAMLLGAAKLLKAHEGELRGAVKLMFQPGEETAHGAPAMIEAGLLENPKVDAAVMLHVFSGLPLPSGTFIVSGEDFVAAACDTFDIEIKGVGGHGAMPNYAIDPLNIAAHTHLALQEINSREVAAADPFALTVGYMLGGSAYNVIPDSAKLGGSVRTYDPKNRDLAQKRLEEIALGTARTFRGEAKVTYTRGSPAFRNDKELAREFRSCLAGLFGETAVLSELPGVKLMGSEDFAFVSERVGAVMGALAAGEPKDGYIYPQHHPQIRFDEEVLWRGAAAYAAMALDWLRGQERSK